MLAAIQTVPFCSRGAVKYLERISIFNCSYMDVSLIT